MIKNRDHTDLNVYFKDFRDPKNGARYRFEGKSESVRDVQFNPVSMYEFAAAFETGTIQVIYKFHLSSFFSLTLRNT